MNERNDPESTPENQPAPTGDEAAREGRNPGAEPARGASPESIEQKKRRRRRRRARAAGSRRTSEGAR